MSALSRLFNKSLVTRLVSGIILVILALLTIITGGDVLFATVLIISLIGVFELYRVYKIHDKVPGFIGYAAVIVYYALLRFNLNEWIMIALVLSLMAFMMAYVFTYPKYKTDQIAVAFFGIVYVAVMLSYIYSVRMTTYGVFTVWLIFLASWGSDTCAYAFGVMFGKHKMAPVLSPKKSVEGAVGGVLGSALLGFIYACAVGGKMTDIIDARIMFPIVCFFGALISMVGDLAASAIKRHNDIKDYGTLIPGHGGILDRFDSVIFTSPLIWLLVVLMSRI